MNDEVIVATYVIIAEVLTAADHRDHPLAQVSDAEVLTVASVAAAYLQNHQARALQGMQGMRYLSGHLSASRFNRRLHALGPWLEALLEPLGTLFATGEAFVLDSLPVPVCRRVRARRCRKARGQVYCGYCAAKREKVFGWWLHLVTTPANVGLRAHRTRIETTNSQLEAIGLQRLRARTNPGFALKVHASRLALTITNLGS